ncbi:MAG: AmmeMemoRadiSam system radical SAM enzyme [Candidatus Eisenbacteria bacterium]|nr:AmmeMemoRadiSam system radical SAM enzyme [Candidatus Eisenbacteria bacterium]
MVEAKYWSPAEDERVTCELCPQRCVIPEGGHGICLGRVNRGGKLFAENFGECVSAAVDPIEKKPLYHVCPGHQVLSVACNGCNLRCDFCQNWTIAQTEVATTSLPPDRLVEMARSRDSFGIAYTYTEPLVWFEYLLAAGAEAHRHGLKNILVTNGIINEAPMRELLPLVDAMNIDLKSMNADFYRKYCHVDGLEAVKRSIRLAAEDSFLEVTNLLIPGLNDSEDETKELVDFLAEIDPAIPLHFSRYFPTHKLAIEPTPVETLRRAKDIADERLRYVYMGNVGLAEDANTYCPEDGNLLIRRTGYSTEVVGVEAGRCSGCGRLTDFIWCEE